MGLKNRIIKAVEASSQEIIEFLQDLIRIPSVNPPGKAKECAEKVIEKMNEIGLEVNVIDANGHPNVIGVLMGCDEGPRLLFNGHMDVVPAGDDPSKWMVDPFSAKIIDGCIYGRGACDMKSGVAAMIMSASILKREKIETKGDLILTVVDDEETGGRYGTGFLVENKHIDADMGVVGEPTSLRVDIAHKGILGVEIVTRGKAVHGSRPWLGSNAIYKMNDVITALRLYEKQLEELPPHKLLGNPTINVGTIKGGIKTNIVPDTCEITVDRRLIPDETCEEVYDEIKEVLSIFQCEIEITNCATPVEVSPNERIVEILKKAVMNVKGFEPQLGGKTGTTDATYLVNKLGVPTVICGPGVPEKCAHVINEYVEIEQVIDATKIYALTIIDALK